MRDKPIPIERDEHILRARRTAASTRCVLGVLGLALILAQPALLPSPALNIAGFATILISSIVQLASARTSLLRVEESLAAAAAILIVGLGDQRVTILSVLWLVAVATGVMARGGRVHWVGRTVVLVALALPILREGRVEVEYAALCFAVIGLQLTSGRLTRELNRLLRQARMEAESAETLLLAGDIAARMEHRVAAAATARPAAPEPEQPLSAEEEASARRALAQLIEGGVRMAVQPIVDIRDGTVPAYEALARFERRRADSSPLHWFALADQLGERAALERACLGGALELFERRPAETRLSVNLSLPTLLEPETVAMLEAVGRRRPRGLEGLVVEITEETLVGNDLESELAIAALRERGAKLAVDDIGAGYSGLRQITAVVPDYLKLDRALVCGIDQDRDRAALVSALAGYADQVGSMVVAEGVEHRSELECVRELGVPLVQGFFLAVPGKPWPGVSAEGRRALPDRAERPAPALALAP